MSEDLDVDLVAQFDWDEKTAECVVVFLNDEKWNFLERVSRLQRAHSITKAEAEETVRRVIAEKEHGLGVSVTFATRSRSGRDASLLFEDGCDF